MRRRTGSTPLTCSARNASSTQVLLHQHGGQRGQAPGVGAGPHPQVEVGHLRGVGQHRVDHDHRAAGILGDLVEDHAGAREALRHPRVLADEHRHLGVLELAAGVPAVEVGVDPRLTGLLLCQRVGAVVRAERLAGRRRCRRRRGGYPARRRRSRRSCPRRRSSAMRLKPAAISAIAVSQSISS